MTPYPGRPAIQGWIHACTKENTAAPLHIYDMYLSTYEQFGNAYFMLFEGKSKFDYDEQFLIHCLVK